VEEAQCPQNLALRAPLFVPGRAPADERMGSAGDRDRGDIRARRGLGPGGRGRNGAQPRPGLGTADGPAPGYKRGRPWSSAAAGRAADAHAERTR
jgi:hypothetical protein